MTFQYMISTVCSLVFNSRSRLFFSLTSKYDQVWHIYQLEMILMILRMFLIFLWLQTLHIQKIMKLLENIPVIKKFQFIIINTTNSCYKCLFKMDCLTLSILFILSLLPLKTNEK